MDWDRYAQTGMLDRSEGFSSVEAGAIKTTYRVDGDSDSYIIQTVGTGEQNKLRVQRHVYRTLEDTGVPVPAVEHDATDDPVAYQVLEHVPEQDMDALYGDGVDQELVDMAADAGEILAQAHRQLDMDGYGHIVERDGRLTTNGETTWRSFFHSYMKGLASILHDSPFDRDGLADEVDTVLDRLEASFPEQPDARFCHRDYRPGNIRTDDGEITAVLDWDNGIAGDAYYDYIRAEMSFADRFEADDDREAVQEAFHDAYSDTAADLMQPDLYDTYRFCATVDKVAGLAYLIEEEGYGFDDEVIEGFYDALKRQVEKQQP